MSYRLVVQLAAATIVSQGLIGCSRFVWHEDPFTPDPAPTSEIIASGADTTYVLRRDSYYLLTPERSTLWNRDVIDDVAWRYRALFGEAPPTVAIRIDTAATAPDTTTTWRGVPFARVALTGRSQSPDAKSARNRDDQRIAEDSARARILAGPILAATAAEAWLGARTIDAVRVTDSQPGGPTRTTVTEPAMPAWIEAGALRLLGAAGAPDRAAMELRSNEKAILPLVSLFAVKWQTKPNAVDIARAGNTRQFLDEDGGDVPYGGASRTRARRDAVVPGVSPVFMAQSVSLLVFIHERDPALVARLADEVTRGASVESVLASSTVLPHDVASLDAQWRKWLERNTRRQRR